MRSLRVVKSAMSVSWILLHVDCVVLQILQIPVMHRRLLRDGMRRWYTTGSASLSVRIDPVGASRTPAIADTGVTLFQAHG